jgi:1,5-anhydro-D-fructose reductase (1,5-anhydro-D-mannitol-forming)
MVHRWGIIGCGAFVERGMGLALTAAADTKLVSVHSRSPDRAQACAAKYKVERAYHDLDAMLADPGLDSVYIATPNSVHAAQAIRAAQAGKNVLCEKPMALTLRDCEGMIESAASSNVKLGVVFQNRYHPAHVEARNYVASGKLGAIDLVSAQLFRGGARGRGYRGWRGNPEIAGSGAIVAQQVHPLDLMRFILDSEIEEVRAMSDAAPPERPLEEMIYSLVKFRNGVRGTCLSGSLVPRFDNDFLLYGSHSKMTCKGTIGEPVPGRSQQLTIESDILDTKMNFRRDTSVPEKLSRLVEDFNRSVRENTALGISGENGMQMVKIALAMAESARNGKAARID